MENKKVIVSVTIDPRVMEAVEKYADIKSFATSKSGAVQELLMQHPYIRKEMKL